ncbi:MAG TPA: DUF1127 domain-containing protein [Stellaceae bacterium]|nr:DUF1127 domain-containing protein [Stellaceae bacterium]
MLNIIANIGHSLVAAMEDWREKRHAYAELSSLDDRSLADIGITRSEIPYVLTHAAEMREPKAAATLANDTLPHAA